MFLFQSCLQNNLEDQQVYQIDIIDENNKSVVKQLHSVSQFGQEFFKQNTTIRKRSKSIYSSITNKKSKDKDNFVDQDFPPVLKSLSSGYKSQYNFVQWKRLYKFASNYRFYASGTCNSITSRIHNYNLPIVLAALLQKGQLDDHLLCTKNYVENGIYGVKLRINGKIKEVIVDDYIPLFPNDEFVFIKPFNNSVWVLILQKALAKTFGNYQAIQNQNISQIIKALSHAPVQINKLSSKDSKDKRQSMWKSILNLCQINQESKTIFVRSNPRQLGSRFKTNGYYILADALAVDTQETASKKSVNHKILKLRNSFANKVIKQKQGFMFWYGIPETEKVKKFKQIKRTGVFFIHFDEFYDNFDRIFISHFSGKSKYENVPLLKNQGGKEGTIIVFDITVASEYLFELHQVINNLQQTKHQIRGTMLLTKGRHYDFIAGMTRYQQGNFVLKHYLFPGKYCLYARIMSDKSNQCQQGSISVYSKYFIELTPTMLKQHPYLFKKAFLSYARQNKRKTYNEQRMWISWGVRQPTEGFCYIAFGNEISSNKSFEIYYKESLFEDLNMKVKYPKGLQFEQIITVAPGFEDVLILTIKQDFNPKIQFPPALLIKIVPYDQQFQTFPTFVS